MRRSLCSFVSARSHFAYSAVKRLRWYYRKSRFHQRFADQSYEQRASCKGESLSAIVQEKFSLYFTSKNILSLFFRRIKTRRDAGIDTIAHYSRPIYLIIVKMCTEVGRDGIFDELRSRERIYINIVFSMFLHVFSMF